MPQDETQNPIKAVEAILNDHRAKLATHAALLQIVVGAIGTVEPRIKEKIDKAISDAARQCENQAGGSEVAAELRKFAGQIK